MEGPSGKVEVKEVVVKGVAVKGVAVKEAVVKGVEWVEFAESKTSRAKKQQRFVDKKDQKKGQVVEGVITSCREWCRGGGVHDISVL